MTSAPPDSNAPIELELMTGYWSDLEVHLERGALFLLKEDLSIAEVGRAIAADDVSEVSELINSNSLSRPTIEQITKWKTTPRKVFRFLILQPYVLAQEMTLPVTEQGSVH